MEQNKSIPGAAFGLDAENLLLGQDDSAGTEMFSGLAGLFAGEADSQLAAELADQLGDLDYPQLIQEWIQNRTILSLVIAGLVHDPKNPAEDCRHPLAQPPQPLPGLFEIVTFLHSCLVFVDFALQLAISDPEDPRLNSCPRDGDPVRWLLETAYRAAPSSLETPTLAEPMENLAAGEDNAKHLGAALSLLWAAAVSPKTLLQQLEKLSAEEPGLAACSAPEDYTPEQLLALESSAGLTDGEGENNGFFPNLDLVELLSWVPLAIHYALTVVLAEKELSQVASLIFLGPTRTERVLTVLAGDLSKPVDYSVLEAPRVSAALNNGTAPDDNQPEPPQVEELLSLYGFNSPILTDFRDLATQQVELYRLINQASQADSTVVETGAGEGTIIYTDINDPDLSCRIELENQAQTVFNHLVSDYRHLYYSAQNQPPV